ncbi:MAG: two-component regulator propeller domain-containing protein [Acidobacteriota bacterium]|nr:two-component regulator propeller domain-containing protein [Acidobacteriota bacterium]
MSRLGGSAFPLLILVLLRPLPAAAQEPYVHWDKLGLDQGLSQSNVYDIAQDEPGFLWFATQDGLNRYDGKRFHVYRQDYEQPNSVAGNFIPALEVDHQGRVWAGTRNGLSRYNPAGDSFDNFRLEEGLPHLHLTALHLDNRGLLWVGTIAGIAVQEGSRFKQPPGVAGRYRGHVVDLLTVQDEVWVATQDQGLLRMRGESVKRFSYGGGPNDIGALIVFLEKDRRGKIWVGTDGAGLYRVDPENGIEAVFRHEPDNPMSLSDNRVTAFHKEVDGRFWVGTEAGLSCFDPETKTFTNQYHRPEDPNSLGAGRKRSILVDKSGVLWVSTAGFGLSYYDLSRQRFPHFKHVQGDPDTLADNQVAAILEDSRGALWIGHRKGFSYLEKGSDRFVDYLPEPDRPGGLKATVISSFWEDGPVMWMASVRNGLVRYDRNNERFDHFIPPFANPQKKGVTLIFDLMEDRSGNLWVGAHATGMLIFDRRARRFVHLTDPLGLLEKTGLTFLYQDKQGVIWIGTSRDGLYRRGTDGSGKIFNTRDKGPDVISGDQVMAILEDSRGRLWVGHNYGLDLMDRETGSFIHYGSVQGLANETIYALLEDRTGHLWMSTNDGISRFNPNTDTFTNYKVSDGLQSREFNNDAVEHLRDGRMAFGGVNGFNLFDPSEIKPDLKGPRVVFSEMLLFNKPVKPAPDSSLTEPIGVAEEVRLAHRQSVVSFEFAALHFADPGRNTYAYRMEGLNENWIETGPDRNFASFTGLQADTYTLSVKAKNKDGVWGPETPLRVVVYPPPWRTWWAYSLYVLAVSLLILAYLRAQQRKLEYERHAVTRLQQLDRLKDEFLANTTHELRTPLNGIIGLAESILQNTEDMSEENSRGIATIAAGGRRLNALVSDILDFSSLKEGSLNLVLRPLALRPVAEAVLELARPLLSGKDIVLKNAVSETLPTVHADENRLTQILWNLVHNAVKFTEEGRIIISAEPSGDQVILSVADTGPGIPESQKESIFESFHQSDGSMIRSHGGTGLGLALTGKLVALHDGEITVDSEFGKGSTFSFNLAVSNEPPANSEIVDYTRPLNAPVVTGDRMKPVKVKAKTSARYHILVVDDERINRVVVTSMLSREDYRITEASGGKEALAVIKKEAVDLVLLDIMMPKMSGYDVCREIRRQYGASELPVLFLTARERLADITMGFESGCNDYLTKPVAREELLARVKLHLDLLDLQRALEDKVKERTEELEEKNRELKSRYQELEALEEIARTINAEMEFSQLLHTILELALELIPGVQRASFIFFDHNEKKMQVVESVGREKEVLMGEEQEIAGRVSEWYRTSTEVAEGVMVVKQGLAREHPWKPEARIALPLPLERRMSAMVILDNLEDEAAFTEVEAGKLSRFREHAFTAVLKGKVISDLVDTQRGLVEEAHQAGMAEIAASVMHNVGNNLNSIKTSIHVIQEAFHDKKQLELLDRLSRLLDQESDQLGAFFSRDPRAEHVPRALSKISHDLTKVWDLFRTEGERLVNQVHGMTRVLREQHQYAGLRGRMAEICDLNTLVEDAVRREAYLIREVGIHIKTELPSIPPLRLERGKCLRVLLFLLRNAREAIEERGNTAEGKIILTTRRASGQLVLEIRDNGAGIERENRERVFAQGFTTKKDHQGLGLHYAANVMKDHHGTISVHSRGSDRGAAVTLKFPTEGFVESN